MDILYSEGNNVYARNAKGQITKLPKNKFEEGEYVVTSTKHHSPNDFTRLVHPSYALMRGWVYGQEYVSLQGRCGGSSFAWDEDEFEKITDPIVRLYAERLRLNDVISKCESTIADSKKRLGNIEYSLSISIPDWDKIERVCSACGGVFTRNSININLSYCDKCNANQ